MEMGYIQCSTYVYQIDKVGYPSWQTQISGYKKWTLRTPVECLFKCKQQFEVLMEPGSTSEYSVFNTQTLR